MHRHLTDEKIGRHLFFSISGSAPLKNVVGVGGVKLGLIHEVDLGKQTEIFVHRVVFLLSRDVGPLKPSLLDAGAPSLEVGKHLGDLFAPCLVVRLVTQSLSHFNSLLRQTSAL